MKIFFSLLVVISFISLGASQTALGKCPTACGCYLDTRGRNTVECKQGGLRGPLQFTNVSEQIEVLKITAPDDNLNDLSMNPDIKRFRRLEEIHITKSNIPNLGETFFYFLKKLEVLNLAQNNITQPLPMSFYGLIHLQHLCLDDNRIDSLPSETFRYLTDLRVLSVQRNRIHQMAPGVFRGLIKLRVLKLSGNFVRHFAADVFKDLRDLRRLECRGCYLKTINRHVLDLVPQLSFVDLSENEIKVLDPGDFANTTGLHVLKLDANQIKRIPDGLLVTHAGISNLSFARNEIARIDPGAFANLPNLTALDLGYNKLTRLTLSEPLESIERLVVSGNRIPLQDIHLLLLGTPIKDLQLADGGIGDILTPFAPDNLQVLNLANNQLSLLSASVLPVGLRELDLSRNLFRGLDSDVAERIASEQTLHVRLDHNPWSCDLCHIIPMLERANRSEDLQRVRCALPYHHTNKLLGGLQREELAWCNAGGADGYATDGVNFFLAQDDGRLGMIAAGASLALLIATSVLVLAALCYSRRHAANYYTHEEQRDEKESIFENGGGSPPLFGEELSFKFPLDANDLKISIATIDEIKKEQDISSTTTTLTAT